MVASYIAALVGILDLARGVLPPGFAQWATILPGEVIIFEQPATLVVGLLLLMTAHGLRRRKRRAWRAVVALLLISATVELLIGHRLTSAAISLALVALLLLAHREFHARSDPRSRRRALVTVAVLGSLDLGIGWLVVAGHSRTMIGDPTPAERLLHVLLGLIGIEGPVSYSSFGVSELVYYSLLALGLLTLASGVYLLLRPEQPVAVLGPADETRMRALLERYGSRDSLGYMALRRDKSVIFSPSEKAAIAYRVVGGVMLASGDPIGDVEAWPGVIQRFIEVAHRHAWTPAVIGCSEVGGRVWAREAGLSALELGDEAIVDTATFSLQGRAMRNVRQMVNRTLRAGYTCQVRRVHELTRAERELIAYAAGTWRGSQTERGFSMALGRFGDPTDGDCLVVTARDSSDRIRAVLHFVPWGDGGISLDLMRRDRQADPGLNELLIVTTLQAAPSLGINAVSLNFAMFRSALALGERLGAGPVIRAWRAVLTFLSRWFQIESLYRFNAKFDPAWEPRFVMYPAARDLPRIGMSALRAEAFLTLELPRPFSRTRTQPRHELTRAGHA